MHKDIVHKADQVKSIFTSQQVENSQIMIGIFVSCNYINTWWLSASYATSGSPSLQNDMETQDELR